MTSSINKSNPSITCQFTNRLEIIITLLINILIISQVVYKHCKKIVLQKNSVFSNHAVEGIVQCFGGFGLRAGYAFYNFY